MYAADARHDNPALADKLAQLYTLRGGPGIDLTIRAPYLDLLKRLNDPHMHLPPVIHVAGTNGKGSVVALLRAILTAAGYRVHVYTSPHLVRFNERIVIAGEEISDQYLEELLDEVTAANAGGELTFFEITTAVAFLAFSRNKADITLLETGLGGRLDCTNVTQRPICTAITSIGHDHNEFLGPNLTDIAREKAGIMKPNCPCVIGPVSDPDVREVLIRYGAEIGAPVLIGGRDWHATPLPDGHDFQWEIEDTRETLPRPALTGAHQVANAGVALAVLRQIEKLDYLIAWTAYGEGLGMVRWPARLQQIERGPLLAMLPEGSRLWIDGGHNEAAAQALAAQMKTWKKQGDMPLHVVVAMMQTKRAADFLKQLAPLSDTVVTTEIAGESKCWPAAELAALAAQNGAGAVHSAPDLTQALKLIAAGGRPGRVLVCGSLYLAGSALALNAVKS